MIRSVLARSAVALAATPLTAGTIVVDAQRRPGWDFDDLPQAVAAAEPGDTLLVHAGVYRPVAIEKQLTLLGLGAGALVDGEIVVRGVDRRVAIDALSPRTLTVEDCHGAVSVQRMPALERVHVRRSRDVRLHEVAVVAPAGSERPAVDVVAARLELGSSVLRGAHAGDSTAASAEAPDDGAPALLAGPGSRIHVARTNLLGGAGGAGNASFPGGAGGDALRALADAVVFLSGDDTTDVSGGAGGWASDPSGARDGAPGLALRADDRASCTWSLARLSTGVLRSGAPAATGAAATSGVRVVEARTVQPTIAVTGWPLAGGAILVHIRGEPLARVRFWFGRKTTLHPLPDGGIETLARELLSFELGPLPTSGATTFVLQVSPTYSSGTHFTCQAELKDARSSARQRSNSLPLVVR